LSLKEIEKVSRSMGRLVWLYLSGGEPFLRDDLVELCEIFYRHNRPVTISIPTNGIAVERVVAQTAKICEVCPQTKIVISVSVDDLGEKHDQMRGVKEVFTQVEKLMPRLKKLQEKYANLGLQINMVFCHQNQDRIESIYNKIKQKFAPDNITVSLVRGEPREVGVKEVQMDKYRARHLKMEEERRFGQYPGWLAFLVTKKEDYQARIFYRLRKINKPVISCLIYQTVVLYPNGDLAMCELRGERYGNVREADYDFQKLWHSAKAKKYRQRARKCYCSHECVYTPNIFLNPLVWPRWLRFILFKKV
ncbi:hypothetical protein MUP65_00570, partial [Patescibacteria group bacterium]|nr:hypothetical protein [Patescibacteria group bacterium]